VLGKIRKTSGLLLLAATPLILLSSRGLAQDPLKPFRTETPPVIDGKLEESMWAQVRL
jgi:hypothetical protein